MPHSACDLCCQKLPKPWFLSWYHQSLINICEHTSQGFPAATLPRNIVLCTKEKDTWKGTLNSKGTFDMTTHCLKTYRHIRHFSRIQYRSQTLTWIFQYFGISAALVANSTLRTSIFFALVHLGFDSFSGSLVQPLNPNPEIITAASDKDHTK